MWQPQSCVCFKDKKKIKSKIMGGMRERKEKKEGGNGDRTKY